MTDLRTYRQAGTTRVEFGPTTDGLLDDLSKEVHRKTVKSIQGLFGASLKKLTGHLHNHSAMDMHKKLPGSFIYHHNYSRCQWTLQITLRCLHSMSHQQSCSMNGLCTRAASGHRMQFHVTSVGNLVAFRKSLHERFPTLSTVDTYYRLKDVWA